MTGVQTCALPISAAVNLCEQVLRRSPEFPDALHLLGLCRWKNGDSSVALDLLMRAQRHKPRDSQLWHNLGIVLEASGDKTGARAAFRRAVELDPNSDESQYNLGVTCEALHDPTAAETAYRGALALNAVHAGAAAGLAALCEADNRLTEAGHWVAVALRENPGGAVANLTQAQLDFRAGRCAETAARLEALLQYSLSPLNRALTFGRMGMAYDRLGRYEHAFIEIGRASCRERV